MRILSDMQEVLGVLHVHVCVLTCTYEHVCVHVGVHAQICGWVFKVSSTISIILSANGVERIHDHWSPNPLWGGIDSVGVHGGNVHSWDAEAISPWGCRSVTHYGLISGSLAWQIRYRDSWCNSYQEQPPTAVMFVCGKRRGLLIPYIMYVYSTLCTVYVPVCVPVDIAACICKAFYFSDSLYGSVRMFLCMLPAYVQCLRTYEQPCVTRMCTYMYVKAVKPNPSQRGA